jgi:hypothetical protein
MMFDAVRIPSNELLAVLTATSFAAGLNVYATVSTLGLLAHAGVIPLPFPYIQKNLLSKRVCSRQMCDPTSGHPIRVRLPVTAVFVQQILRVAAIAAQDRRPSPGSQAVRIGQ